VQSTAVGCADVFRLWRLGTLCGDRTQYRPYDHTDYFSKFFLVVLVLCAVDTAVGCVRLHSPPRPQKSNLVDYCIHDETVFAHYEDNASTTTVTITTLMKTTTARCLRTVNSAVSECKLTTINDDYDDCASRSRQVMR